MTSAFAVEHVSLEINLATHCFVTPRKEITSPTEISSKWEKSEAYRDMIGFILAVNEVVKNKKLTDSCHISPVMENLLKLLKTMEQWIEEIPPIDQPQRFGNKAYRQWFQRLSDQGETLLREALPEKFHCAVPELVVYLRESVGNQTRIDYGTGHEFAFVAFLCCLCKIGACDQNDLAALGLRVFANYIDIMRKVQMEYNLEPAGSQGVWNLDDYQFIPFIWGSAQLLDHPRIKPKSFLNEEMCAAFSKDYMFLGCIQHIHKVKRGPFAEHSNQLYNISGVPTWSKVNSGLIKMYKAEVLSKFPIIQHFVFGSLLRINVATT
jgi:serine/threonine-protein phosphatase 2A activator